MSDIHISEKNALKLTSPIPDSVNHYLSTRIVYRNVNGKKIPTPMMYESATAKKYKFDFANYIKEQVDLQDWKFCNDDNQHFYCDCVFYFDRKKKDANNYFKLLLDAITESGVVWIDDKVVCERVERIMFDSENPRIELKIYPVEYVGIFDTQLDEDLFENKCSDCNRYARNCSILRKAKEGVIQEEIGEDMVCVKYKKRKS